MSRAIDVLVQRHVVKLDYRAPLYSSRIGHAWELVECLKRQGYFPNPETQYDLADSISWNTIWKALFQKKASKFKITPLSICVAALRAKEVPEDVIQNALQR